MTFTSDQRRELDNFLSGRDIPLDPSGYFLIKIDKSTDEIIVEHYGNTINEAGQAVDPETGEVIPCTGGGPRKASHVYRGRTAKEVGIAITEGPGRRPLSMLHHALYLGRELQKAERCLEEGKDYMMD